MIMDSSNEIYKRIREILNIKFLFIEMIGFFIKRMLVERDKIGMMIRSLNIIGYLEFF